MLVFSNLLVVNRLFVVLKWPFNPAGYTIFLNYILLLTIFTVTIVVGIYLGYG